MIICIPSRGRPHRLECLLHSFALTRTTARLYVRLDLDDPLIDAYRGLHSKHPTGLMVVGPRVDVAGAMQETLRAYPDEDCYLLVGDDTAARTYRWDDKLKESAGDWRISYPDDGLKGESQATHPCIGGAFLRAIGFWALPGLSHLYTDTVWDFLGRQYGNLAYRGDVTLEHLHWSAGKAVRDRIYDKPTASEDQRCFSAWTAGYRIDTALSARIAASAAAA